MINIREKINLYGADILSSAGMELEKTLIQHGRISCYEHSVRVAEMSLRMAARLPFRFRERELVRGALLHDYFLYDWHKKEKWHRLHGFSHAERALERASRDFALNDTERDIIQRHMFPLNIRLPKYRESWLVCLVDKVCAISEIFHRSRNSEKRIREPSKKV